MYHANGNFKSRLTLRLWSVGMVAEMASGDGGTHFRPMSFLGNIVLLLKETSNFAPVDIERLLSLAFSIFIIPLHIFLQSG
jgi:hypothetical protein